MYPLTSFPKKLPFEMVIAALICTAFINVIMTLWCGLLVCIGTRWNSFGEWESEGKEFWSFFLAAPIGLLVAYWKNNDSLNEPPRPEGRGIL
jgi:hypothetical protein